MKSIKKLFIILLAFASINAFAVGFSACKQSDKTVTEGDFTFEKIDGKDEYALIAYNKNSTETDVIIPNTYNGKPVTEIGEKIFNSCDKLTSVTIPNSITVIGDDTFQECENLTSVTIGNSVTTIGSRSFVHCYRLTNVTLGSSLTTIKKDAFHYCHQLSNVYYTGDIASWCAIDFEDGFSSYLKNSSNLNLYINNQLIAGDLILPDNVEKINDYAFGGCTKLTSITISNSVTLIQSNAFYYCPNLVNIKFQDTSTWYYTNDYQDWENKANGTQIDVNNTSQNATYFTDTYSDYYWYKL